MIRDLKDGKRVCMVTHSFYESDNRVLRYAEALAQRGDSVEVFALRRSPGVARSEVINGVQVHRIQDRFGKEQQSKASYFWPLLRFLLVCSWQITKRHSRERYDFVHIHNVPDFLVFAAWYPRLTGAKLILDIHDIVPEFFGSKFKAGEKSPIVWGLKVVEKLSAAFAHHVILSNHLWLEKYTARSAPKSKCSVFINNVDSRIFQPAATPKRSDKLVVIFPGGLQWHQGVDLAIRAFTRVREQLPNAEFHIYGEGNMKASLIQLTEELGLSGSVRFAGPRPLREIAEVMSSADLGVVPKRADSFGNEAYSTKIMEFMSLGVPVVVSSTKVDRYYFDDTVVRFFESGNTDALAEAMLEMLTNQDKRQAFIERASVYAKRNSWDNRRLDYLQLVDSLCEKEDGIPAQAEAPSL